MIDVMKKLSEIAENYDNEDIQAGIVAAGKTHSVVAKKTVQESAVKDMMQDVEEGMTKAEFAKKYPGMADQYDEIKQEIKDKMNESVNEAPGGQTISESSAGDAVKQAYDAVYEFVGQYDDAALEYLDDNAPMFSQMFEKYEDLDSLVKALDDATLMQLKDELDSVADDLSDGVLESVNEVHEDVESDETELDRMLYLGGVMGSSSNNIMIKENSEVPVQEDRKDDMISWVEKYENYIGRNGDSLPEGYVQWAMNSGIATDAMEQDEVDAMIKKYGEDKFEDDPMSFIDEMPITKAYMQELEQITGTDDIEDNAEMIRMFVESATNEASVEEASVEVPVQELQDILQLAGFENYAEKIEEYANEPNEEYGDSEEQMVGLSGGLNGPKTHYPAAAGGDNPMNVKPLKVDDVYESFYTKYDKFIAELNNQNK